MIGPPEYVTPVEGVPYISAQERVRVSPASSETAPLKTVAPSGMSSGSEPTIAAPLLFAGRELTKVAGVAVTMLGVTKLPSATIRLKTLNMPLEGPEEPGIVTIASRLF